MESTSLDQYFAAATGKSVKKSRRDDPNRDEVSKATDHLSAAASAANPSYVATWPAGRSHADDVRKLDKVQGTTWLPTKVESTSTKEEREANRLARLAEARAAKLPRAEMNRPSPKPPTPRMATTKGPDGSVPPAPPPPTIQGEPPLRLRLDASRAEGNSGEVDEATLTPSGRFRLLQAIARPYLNFYRRCPNCLSEEVYALERSGRFLRSKSERSLIAQKLYCERCITAFVRPGLLFGAPPPAMRPDEGELYD